MTAATIPDRVLQETLANLEAALLAPPIPGEMGHWARGVKQSAATLATDWARELHSILYPQHEEISRTDAEMAACVEKLRQQEEELAANLVRFHEALHHLEEAAAHVDWHEARLAPLQKVVENDGLQLILKMKKQQATSATWLAEALYRDRGVKD